MRRSPPTPGTTVEITTSRDDPLTGGAATEVQAKAAALKGWLRGLVEAEAFEMKTRAEAEAYAAERVRAERRVGFNQSDS